MTSDDKNVAIAKMAINAFNTGETSQVNDFISSNYVNKE